MSISTSISPLYKKYFLSQSLESNWENFKTTEEEEIKAPLSARSVDFSTRDTTWMGLDKTVLKLAFKVAIIFYGIYLFGGAYLLKQLAQILPNLGMSYLSTKIFTKSVIQIGSTALKILFYSTFLRYVLQRIIMIPLYPAQSRIVRKFICPALETKALNNERIDLVRYSDDFICKDVVLEKNGVRYSGMLIGHQDTIHNGNWALQATGNGEPIEHAMEDAAWIYHQHQFNTLMINGPGVGKSQGTATPSTMGDAQEVGISFLETALKAKKIVIAGRSLGGAAIAQAILQHDFKEDVKYLVVSQMTFDRTSNICGKVMGQISPRLEWVVGKIIQLTGCEIDSIKASKKLQSLNIQEVIVQASHREVDKKELPRLEDFQTDGPIIDQASLGYALIQQNITDQKVFLCLPNAEHMTNAAISAPSEEIKAL